MLTFDQQVALGAGVGTFLVVALAVWFLASICQAITSRCLQKVEATIGGLAGVLTVLGRAMLPQAAVFIAPNPGAFLAGVLIIPAMSGIFRLTEPVRRFHSLGHPAAE